MFRRLVLPLLLSALAVPGAFAQGDPRMSTYEADGSFVVNYFGTRPDGTECPPSVNALDITISDGQEITGLHSLAIAEGKMSGLAAAFEGACRVNASGHLWVGTHHGTNAKLTPNAAEPVAVAPVHQGMFSIEYYPIMCVVAPCPPGVYAILDDAGNLLARVDAILIEGPMGTSVVRGQYLDWESDIGTIWLDDSTLAEMRMFEAGETRARIRLATNL